MNFDTLNNRQGTFSSKWDKYTGRDVIPLWVADMDFKSPQPVLDALHKRVDHGIFGYTKAPAPLLDVILERIAGDYDWQLNPEDIVFMPGVVPGLNMACRMIDPHLKVATTTPVYYPFLSAPVYSGRGLLSCEAEFRDDRWHFPVQELTDILRQGNVGVLLLCSPYNPIGRLLTRDELERTARVCADNEVVICSDEIHCDLVFDGGEHIPTATLGAEVADNTITLMAPSKTFNIAGLGGSFAIVQNRDLRKKFIRQSRGIMPDINLLAYEAMLAAYRDCDDWHQQLISYLQGNRDLLYKEIGSMPGIEMNRVEATYLAWLDIRQLELENPMAFFEQAGLGLSDGSQFGGPGFMRLNFGCPRSLLHEAIERLDKAVRGR